MGGVCVYECASQRLMTPGVLNCPLSYVLSQGLLLNLELTNLISLISQLVAGSPCLCLPSTGVKTGHNADSAFTQGLGISAQVPMLT